MRRLDRDSAAPFLSALASMVGGLAASRVAYEWLFPRVLWLGQLIPAVIVAAMTGFLGWLLWRWLSRRAPAWTAAVCFLPLVLNLVYFPRSTVDLLLGRLLFLGSLWLAAFLMAQAVVHTKARRWMAPLFLAGLLVPIYLLTMGRTVGQADTFEFQVVVPKLGIAHPSGYPLYLLLSKLFTFVPANQIAWRVNLASAAYGLAATLLLFLLIRRLTGQSTPALGAAVLFGLTPTFWSQAVVAEVYTLHTLIVAAALFLLREIGGWRLGADGRMGRQANKPTNEPTTGRQSVNNNGQLPSANAVLLLAFILGLGLTNHLTTLILLPPAVLTLLIAYRSGRLRAASNSLRLTRPKRLIALLAAFLMPLLLYAYLPIRWAAVNGEAMGLRRFVDWVVGGRFRGALQLTAWVRDPTRYEVVGRLFRAEWQPIWLLLLVTLGAFWLLARQRSAGIVLLLTWLGFVFYGLNYLVPDIAVFLIPAHLVMAVFWGVGLAALAGSIRRLAVGRSPESSGMGATGSQSIAMTLLALALSPVLVNAAANTWPAVDASADKGQTAWGRAVLAQPLDEHGAILADSEKIAPLYYLQQVEGQRPEMDIMVLPDEAAYRAELDSRLSAGQTVYLARYLPRLEGIYHLRSVGPLTEVSQEPLLALAPGAVPSKVAFDTVHLLGYELESPSPYSAGEAAITLYWQARRPVEQALLAYVRWAGPGYLGPVSSQHPANNYYPTPAWEPGEIVPDFHALPRPVVDKTVDLNLQVALAPPFSKPADLPWQTLTTATFTPQATADPGRALRMQLGPAFLTGVAVPGQARPGETISVVASGCGEIEDIVFALIPARSRDNGLSREERSIGASVTCDESAISVTQVSTADAAGRYTLFALHPDHTALCGWLAAASDGCPLAEVTISGLPLPDGATNFEDKIALLSLEIPQTVLRPGGQLPVRLTWQALAPMDENYTVFVQVLDAEDHTVGQVDAWPLQGTFPTSQWQPGEIVEDPYLVQLSGELPPGQYRVVAGWYLLSTLRRLPVLDESGAAVDDKVTVPGLVAP